MSKTDIKELREVTDQAVSASGAYANPEWFDEAYATVDVLCKQGNDFTADDVWEILDQTSVKTHNRSALGAVMRVFVKEGKMRPAGYYRHSMRRSRHMAPLMVWRPIRLKKRLRGFAYANARD